MRVISEEKLIKLAFRIDDHNTVVSLDDALAECRELQEPWMTLDEFLKSGFEGQCWIHARNGEVFECIFNEDDFMTPMGYVSFHQITHVMPIHKPEPPR